MAIDIDQSFYNIGTASVDAGGTVVTGQGTQWLSSIRANDIFGTHKGDGVRILSIESNTSLTLAYPWSGEAQTEEAYEVQFTPYDTGYYPAVRKLLQTLTSGNIEAFAALDGSSGALPYFTGSGAMGVLPGEPNKVPIFTGTNSMDLADPSEFGIQDPTGSLAKLAALTLVASKILNTDGSGNLTQSDITAAALVLLKLAGTASANKFPFFDTATSTALADLTAQARTMLASTTPAVTSLGYTPANKAGDTFSGPVKLSTPATNWQLQSSFSVGLANTGGYNFAQGNGMVIVTETQRYGNSAIYLFGNSVARLVSQTGTIFGESSNNNIFATHVGGDAYGIANVTGQSVTLQIMSFKTRYVS